MLPGFRFLLAAIFLSVSIVTFGLGAAALLRAAHEEFASMPTRRVTSEPYFAQVPEPPAATLAMLRVEPTPPANAAPHVLKIPLMPNSLSNDVLRRWHKHRRLSTAHSRYRRECTTVSRPMTRWTSNSATRENRITNDAEASTDGLKSVSMPKNSSTG